MVSAGRSVYQLSYVCFVYGGFVILQPFREKAVRMMGGCFVNHNNNGNVVYFTVNILIGTFIRLLTYLRLL